MAASSSVLVTATFTPGSDLATNDAKYYWRWAYSTDAGVTWSPWSEKYSFWLKSTFGASVTPTTWTFANAADVTDRYAFSVYPRYAISEEQILRAQRRNLAGLLLTELTIVKAKITLSFESGFIDAAQRNELLRFYNLGDGFFVLAAITDGTNTVEKVWRCVMPSPPTFTMLDAGREDWYVAAIELEEV